VFSFSLLSHDVLLQGIIAKGGKKKADFPINLNKDLNDWRKNALSPIKTGCSAL
jgi:hypothetical protein